MFSHRTAGSRVPNRIAELLGEARSSGRKLCDLTSSNPTTCGIAYPPGLLGILERAQGESLVYAPEPFGLLSAREAVAQRFATAQGRAAEPQDILLTASSSEAYSFLFKLLCDPGDVVAIPAPSYPLFEYLAELESVQVAPYRLDYDGAWHIDLDSVRRAAREGACAIVVVSPNNPTGNYLAASELQELGELGLPLIVDQVFHEYPFDGVARPQTETEGLLFRLGGLSKLAGLPQLKLGWTVITGPEPARREARERLELIADTFLSVATPVQQALPELLAASPAVTAAISSRCRQNLAHLQQSVVGSPLSVLRAEGGWSAVLRLPQVKGEEELVTSLLSEQHVLVQPGFFYDFETEPYAIVSLLTEPSVFADGTERLVQHAARSCAP